MAGPLRGALTLSAPVLLRELKSTIRVGTPVLDMTKPPARVTSDVTAIWDTGATGSVITQAVVDQLAIQPITMTMVHGVDSQKITPVYLVEFYLPMGVCVPGLNVTLGELFAADALIGMDVISQGDFAITNLGGKTKMTFRVPSLVETDFVKEAADAEKASRPPQASREQRRAQKKATTRRSAP
jgi:hypothetical protein